MLTSRRRTTGAGAGQGAALPRRVPGASQREIELGYEDEMGQTLSVEAAVASAEPTVGMDGALKTTDLDTAGLDTASLDVADLDTSEVDLSDLPDVSGLLARLVEERIPMALMIDLVNPSGPGPEADGARSDME